MLCSCGVHRPDASGGVPALAGPRSWWQLGPRFRKMTTAADATRLSDLFSGAWVGAALTLCSVFGAPSAHGAPASLRIFGMMLRFRVISFAALRKSGKRGTKVQKDERARSGRLYPQRPGVWCVRRGVIVEDEWAGLRKDRQLEHVWLGPAAAPWAAHRLSQVCNSALEVDQSKSEHYGGHYKVMAFLVYDFMFHTHLKTRRTTM